MRARFGSPLQGADKMRAIVLESFATAHVALITALFGCGDANRSTVHPPMSLTRIVEISVPDGAIVERIISADASHAFVRTSATDYLLDLPRQHLEPPSIGV